MSKAVLVSIHPKWCELIASGEKTLEVRKARPKVEIPFKCYIYCTKSDDMFWVLNTISRMDYGISAVCANLEDYEWASRGDGKVIGEFVCDTFVTDNTFGHDALFNGAACMNEVDAVAYSLGSPMYGWHISDLKTYGKPKELSEFYVFCDRCDKKAIRCEYGYEESTENGYYSECMCDFKRPIKRPHQSWCYVEELECGDR